MFGNNIILFYYKLQPNTQSTTENSEEDLRDRDIRRESCGKDPTNCTYLKLNQIHRKLKV